MTVDFFTDNTIGKQAIEQNRYVQSIGIVTDDSNGSESQKIGINEIISFALEQQYVLGARAFEYDGSIVIAVITTPFYLKSERDSAKSDLSERLNLLAGNNVTVTFDVGIYRNIRDNLSADDMKKLYELAKVR